MTTSRFVCAIALVCAAGPSAGCGSQESSAKASSPSGAPATPARAPTESAGASARTSGPSAQETPPVVAVEFDQVGAERNEAPANESQLAEGATDALGGKTLYLNCGGDGPSFGVRVEGEQAELALPHGNVRLAQVESAQGARYTNGEFTLWSDGDSATYQDDQGNEFRCTNDPEEAVWRDARRRGVEMRAVGPERGGWVLEMTLTGTTLFLAEGQERIDIDTPSPKGYLESDGESYWARDDDEYTLLRVTREDDKCADPRTGEKFDMSVEVALNGQPMRGCGRNLRDRPYQR